MTGRTSRWTTDLLVVLTGAVLATVVVSVGVEGSVLRSAVMVPFVVFLPGYAFVSALFPAKGAGRASDADAPVAAPGTVGDSLSAPARVGLAVAASLAMLPAVLLASDHLLGAVRPLTGFVALVVLTEVLTLVALARRWALDPSERFAVPAVTRIAAAAVRSVTVHDRSLSTSSAFLPTSRRDVLVNVLLVASVAAFVGSGAVAYAAPTQGEQFTELYLVTETADGEFVAADYPRTFAVGQQRPLHVTVANHEGERTPYTLVATLQRVERTANGSTVVEERELLRRSATLDAGETRRVRHDLRPPFGGGRLRVQYLLYRGDPPTTPSRATAYRRVHLWITVDGPSGGGA